MKIEITDFVGSETTQYHAYDPELPKVFEALESLITETIPDITVEHIGSSSIPGVGGRNVLDIAIPASPAGHESIREQLKQLGFKDSPFPHYLPLLVASVSTEGRNYPILLYVISPEHTTYKDWIIFRDYMRMHPEDAARYSEVKRKAVETGHTENESYQDEKTPFLQKMNAEIRHRD